MEKRNTKIRVETMSRGGNGEKNHKNKGGNDK